MECQSVRSTKVGAWFTLQARLKEKAMKSMPKGIFSVMQCHRAVDGYALAAVLYKKERLLSD